MAKANLANCTYEFPFLYYKKGDDFADHLKTARGNVSKALAAWAQQMRGAADVMDNLAQRCKGQKISADGQTHMVHFSADSQAGWDVLEQAFQDQLLDSEEDILEGDEVVESRQRTRARRGLLKKQSAR